MRAAVALLLLLALAACSKPDPLATFKQAQASACACKDLACAAVAERDVTAAVGGKLVLPDGAEAVIAAARRCIHTMWAKGHPLPSLPEAQAPTAMAGPCESIVPKLTKALACTSMPLATLDHLHRTFGEVQAALVANPPMRELDLFEVCLAASSAVMTFTMHARCP